MHNKQYLRTATMASLLVVTASACDLDEGRPNDELLDDELLDEDRLDDSVTTFERRISSGADDIEEREDGSIYASSSDLELVVDALHGTKLVGMRFANVQVPKGATITRAYVQFTADEVTTGAASLVVRAELTSNAQGFTSEANAVSGRTLTEASAAWSPGPWQTTGTATANERTPELKGMIQGIVNREGWSSGNAMAIVITGSGTRTAKAYEGSTLEAPLLHIEYTGGGGSSGGGGPITHVDTKVAYDSNGEDLTIQRPSGTTAGDLLVLILHRTDDDLPLRVSGWTREAECFKRDNGYDCSTEDDCTAYHDANFCKTFGTYGGSGHDLAQTVFYRVAGSNEPSSYQFDLNVVDNTGHPGWAILTALRGAATNDPVRAWSHEGCDNVVDSLFPSVYGEKGDMVLLSQSFDDAIAASKFNAPDGTTRFGYVSQSDEAGFLFGGILGATGDTGAMKTLGDGGPSCKDALVSLTIRPK